MLLGEKLRIFFIELCQNRVFVRPIHCDHAFVRHLQEGFPVLDGTVDASADKSAFEESWIVNFGHLDSFIFAPIKELLGLLSD